MAAPFVNSIYLVRNQLKSYKEKKIPAGVKQSANKIHDDGVICSLPDANF